MADVRIEGLKKSYGGQPVLDVAELEVREGEFFSLLGPSGCGKTTTLRSVAGLVAPDEGRIFIGGREVTSLPTSRRNLGMVFQKYALFPHLTVAENVAFGLQERGASRGEIQARVAESLGLVALEGLGERYPHQLSGGQQQRVAMARAVVYRPDVLLLDEPLSNLDVKLRVAMRAELKRLQSALGITTIFVTHDQQEALALSDRLAVMRDGRVEQVGAPEEIYETPRSVFVADFVGATNVLSGTVAAVDGEAGLAVIALGTEGQVAVPHEGRLQTGQTVKVAVKPERVELCLEGLRRDTLAVEVVSVAYLGSGHSYVVALGGQRLEVRCHECASIDGRPLSEGDRAQVRFPPAAIRVFDA